jgi:hypothetical protein
VVGTCVKIIRANLMLLLYFETRLPNMVSRELVSTIIPKPGEANHPRELEAPQGPHPQLAGKGRPSRDLRRPFP